jgi:hypothetical protein
LKSRSASIARSLFKVVASAVRFVIRVLGLGVDQFVQSEPQHMARHRMGRVHDFSANGVDPSKDSCAFRASEYRTRRRIGVYGNAVAARSAPEEIPFRHWNTPHFTSR